MSCKDERAPAACDALTAERLRYFTGRPMTARDFVDEQAYHRSHRLLHNRMLHGWGIACGLAVRPHPNPDCRDKRLLVRCGMAIDCCGRELLVRLDRVTDEIPWDAAPKVESAEGRVRDPDAVLLLCLQYREDETEQVPVLYNEAACASPPMEYGRVRECARLVWHWVSRDALVRYGWRTADGCAPEHDRDRPHDDCGHGERERCCLDLDCPEGHCVPLCVVVADPRDERHRLRIDTTGRRSLGESQARLTHVCWINWPHGGVVSPEWLEHHGRLMARFDRELEEVKQPKGGCGPRGVNACTFVVEYGGDYEDLDFVEYHRIPYLADDRRTAVFELEAERRPGGPFRRLVGHTVYVTIKCDFLLDCHGRPVDGNHVGGRLPSGNGTPGGTFESWFSVVSDEDHRRIMEEMAHENAESAKEV